MSAPVLRGKNTLELNPEALCAIVEDHLRSSYYASSSQPQVRVVDVQREFDDWPESRTFRFVVTTDAEVKP